MNDGVSLRPAAMLPVDGPAGRRGSSLQPEVRASVSRRGLLLAERRDQRVDLPFQPGEPLTLTPNVVVEAVDPHVETLNRRNIPNPSATPTPMMAQNSGVMARRLFRNFYDTRDHLCP